MWGIGIIMYPENLPLPTDTQRNNDAKITFSQRQHDVGDVVLT